MLEEVLLKHCKGRDLFWLQSTQVIPHLCPRDKDHTFPEMAAVSRLPHLSCTLLDREDGIKLLNKTCVVERQIFN